MISTLDRLARQLSESVQKHPATGVFRCRRDMFTNTELFALEMKHIFESSWVYLAHESPLPEINNYFTTHIGRQSVVVTRDKQGVRHGLVNACALRGAMLCRRKQAAT